MSLCMYVHEYMYLCIYVHMYLCRQTCIYACMYIHTHITLLHTIKANLTVMIYYTQLIF